MKESTAEERRKKTRCIRVALVGTPNSGKSTLFNGLVGFRQRVANYPGVTVEKDSGYFSDHKYQYEVIDLPGVVSLAATSLDELVTFRVLTGFMEGTPPPDIVVVILDASRLERQLYLFSQVAELGIPTVLVLNMMDVARKEGVEIDISRLADRLGVPVIPAEAHRRRGLLQLKHTLAELAQSPSAGQTRVSVEFPEPVPQEISQLAEKLQAICSQPNVLATSQKIRWGFLPTGKPTVPKGIASSSQSGLGRAIEGEKDFVKFARFLATRLLLDPPGGLVTGECLRNLPSAVREAVEDSRSRLVACGVDLATVEPQARFAWSEKLLDGVLRRICPQRRGWVDHIDCLATHPVWGLLFLGVVLLITFQAVYATAEPLVNLLQNLLGWAVTWVESSLKPGLLRSLLIEGFLGGVGTVASFLPPIAILFLFIGLLEDSGYLPRAAFVMDRWMAPVGLSGKCFIPLLTCFSCAIPGIMATRVIDDPWDRLRTMLVAPLVPCSARLPVYTLLITAFIPAELRVFWGLVGVQGLVLAAMYFLGVGAAAASAWLFSRTLVRGSSAFFVVELPRYQWPSLRVVLHRVAERVWRFCRLAGTIILGVSLILWGLLNFPRDPAVVKQDPRVVELRGQLAMVPEGTAESEKLMHELRQAELAAIHRNSFLGRFGRLIEPVFWPLGWDWRIGCAVLASFPAREVVVANLGVIFQLGEVDPETGNRMTGVRERLLAAKWEGTDQPLFTLPVALSIMVFFALCVQCASTLVIIGRETNSWLWPIFTFAYMTTLAYVAALLTYQVGTLLIR